mmetsp:Transcript_99340/g.303765  ORF Transcript_99340/g.303765 Transcript_99340/m.303765 type:complete len:222 (+) Transcript_99340:774-1439(+)
MEATWIRSTPCKPGGWESSLNSMALGACNNHICSATLSPSGLYEKSNSSWRKTTRRPRCKGNRAAGKTDVSRGWKSRLPPRLSIKYNTHNFRCTVQATNDSTTWSTRSFSLNSSSSGAALPAPPSRTSEPDLSSIAVPSKSSTIGFKAMPKPVSWRSQYTSAPSIGRSALSASISRHSEGPPRPRSPGRSSARRPSKTGSSLASSTAESRTAAGTNICTTA